MNLASVHDMPAVVLKQRQYGIDVPSSPPPPFVQETKPHLSRVCHGCTLYSVYIHIEHKHSAASSREQHDIVREN
jgi:hypothetical protein